jgi:hypothetical protein
MRYSGIRAAEPLLRPPDARKVALTRCTMAKLVHNHPACASG